MPNDEAKKSRICYGRNLLHATKTYQLKDIFGRELGYILDKNVAKDIRKEWQASTIGKLNTGIHAGFMASS